MGRTALARLVIYTAAIMWIVRLALARPYTFVVLALLIAVMGVLSVASMPMDIFPRINIPVVTVVWSYGGLSPTEMQNRIVTITERAFTTTVNGIKVDFLLTLTGLAAEPLAGADGPRWSRRLASVAMMFAGAAAGAWLVARSVAQALAVAGVIAACSVMTAHRRLGTLERADRR